MHILSRKPNHFLRPNFMHFHHNSLNLKRRSIHFFSFFLLNYYLSYLPRNYMTLISGMLYSPFFCNC